MDTERRSIRINLLFTPSLKKNLEKIAQVKRTSLNDLINKELENVVIAHNDDIKKYDAFYGDEN